jgi:proline iminopeptidase
MAELKPLFPEIECYQSGFIKVNEEHNLYYEQSGNPNGKPVIFLHGGPGAGTSPKVRRFWDPSAYRIILFDQRGCGKSTPFASLNNNTTWDLVEDIEKIRNHLKINKWQVFGGSWGSTLALSYAVKYPEKITELVLRGIFTLREKELLWFYQEGASYLYPDVWEPYLNFIPASERSNMMTAYYKRLTSNNEVLRNQAAKIWSIWEGSTSRLYMDEELIKKSGEDEFALAFARIECHYFVNKGFYEYDGYLIDQVNKYRNIPATIVQGRYDVVCPMISAWDLHRKWPEAELKIVQDAGHSAYEPGTTHELIQATEKYKLKT